MQILITVNPLYSIVKIQMFNFLETMLFHSVIEFCLKFGKWVKLTFHSLSSSTHIILNVQSIYLSYYMFGWDEINMDIEETYCSKVYYSENVALTTWRKTRKLINNLFPTLYLFPNILKAFVLVFHDKNYIISQTDSAWDKSNRFKAIENIEDLSHC